MYIYMYIYMYIHVSKHIGIYTCICIGSFRHVQKLLYNKSRQSETKSGLQKCDAVAFCRVQCNIICIYGFHLISLPFIQ